MRVCEDRMIIRLPKFKWKPESVRYSTPFGYVIDDGAPKYLKNPVEKLARYFQREFRYDFVGYTSNEMLRDGRALLWVEYGDDDKYEYATAASVIHKCEHGYELSWVWVHPFLRRSGILSGSWSYIKEKFPNMSVSRPLSMAMQMFLKKMGDLKE